MLRKLISYFILSIVIADLAGWDNNPACAMLNPAEERKQQSISLHPRLPETSDQTAFTTIVAEKVIEAAEKGFIKKNLKQKHALKYKRDPLSSLDLAQRKRTIKTQQGLTISDQSLSGRTSVSALDLAAERAAQKGIFRIEKRALLPGEGQVGTFGQLDKLRKKGDDLTPHHIPQDAYMKAHGIKRNDGISMMMEQPYPGKGGRHRQMRTHGEKPNLSETPRDALARDVKDARKIYQTDSLYTSEIRESLQEVITQNKSKSPHLFNKK